jgi:hypothetical protein
MVSAITSMEAKMILYDYATDEASPALLALIEKYNNTPARGAGRVSCGWFALMRNRSSQRRLSRLRI